MYIQENDKNYDFPYKWNCKKVLIKIELNGGCQGLRGGRIGAILFKGTNLRPVDQPEDQ